MTEYHLIISKETYIRNLVEEMIIKTDALIDAAYPDNMSFELSKKRWKECSLPKNHEEMFILLVLIF